MTTKDRRTEEAADLRDRAERLAMEQVARSPENPATMSPEETRQVLHELRVHQIELMMQNEELLRAQAELFAERDRYFDLYDLAPVGYCILSVQGLILEANLTTSTLLGMARSALVKQPFSRFILREDQDFDYLNRKQLTETGEPRAWELRMVRNDGTVFWAHLGATAAQDEGGAPVCRLVLSDVPERKRVEDALKESETRLREVLENSLDASYKRNLETDSYDYMSPVFARISGYTEDEMQTMPLEAIMDLTLPDDAAEIKRVIAESMCGVAGTAHQVDYRFKHKDGQYRWLHDQFTVMRDAGGRNLALIGSVSDITERKRAQEALRASEERFRTMFNEAPLGIALIDSLTGRIYSVNPMFAKIAGRTTDEMTNIDWLGITHPDDVQENLDNLALMNAGTIPGFQMEKRYLHPDGTPVWIHMTDASVYVEDKAHPRHLCMIEDITERKQADEDLKSTNEELEKSREGLRAASFYSRNLIETSLDPLITISVEGKITDVNTATEKITGMTRGSLIGSEFADYFTEPELARAGCRNVLAQGQVIDYPLAFRHAAYSSDFGHTFRSIPAAQSSSFRPPVPTHSGHRRSVATQGSHS